MRMLTPSQFEIIVEACVSAHLLSPARRDLLFAGLPVVFRDSLPIHPIPIDQVRSDLLKMEGVPSLEGLDEPPLLLWLTFAARLARPRPEARILRRMATEIFGRLIPIDLSSHASSQKKKLIDVSFEPIDQLGACACSPVTATTDYRGDGLLATSRVSTRGTRCLRRDVPAQWALSTARCERDGIQQTRLASAPEEVPGTSPGSRADAQPGNRQGTSTAGFDDI